MTRRFPPHPSPLPQGERGGMGIGIIGRDWNGWGKERMGRGLGAWKMLTFATLFSGGEGAGVGARAAGLRHIWGIEYDDEIAQVARANGFDVLTAGVQDVNPDDFQRPDVLHASPPCLNFSSAKVGAEESDCDVVLARRVAEFVERLRPAVFTLENVYMYRKSASWEMIRETLSRCGYWMDLAHVNAADFGVAQIRKRMMVRAMYGQMVPYLPRPRPWRGWYDAIKDLIPGLPESNFARWQMERLPRTLSQTVLVSQGISRDHTGQEYGITMRRANEPSFTITANSNMNGMRAFVVDGGNAGRQPTVRMDDEPIFTIDAMRPTKHPRIAYIQPGRVVRMNVRALARFQSFPDDYALPDRSTLAGRVIGNAVPPLLYRRIIEQLAERMGRDERWI